MNLVQRYSYSGHAAPIYHIDVFDSILYSCSSDKMYASWNTDNEQPRPFSIKCSGGIYTFLTNSDHTLLGVSSGHLYVIDLNEKTEVKNIKLHVNGIYSIALGGSVLITGGGDGVVNFIHYPSFKLLRSIKISSKKIRSVVSIPERNSVFIGCGEGSIREFELEYFNEVSTASLISEKSIYSLSHHPTKEALVISDGGGHIKVLNLNDMTLMLDFPAHYDAVYKFQFSPNGKLGASASKDGTVKVWDSDSLELLCKTEQAKGRSLNSLVWLNNSEFYVAGDDKLIHKWQIST